MDRVKSAITQAREKIRMPAIGPRDGLAGVTAAISSVPDGMASGVLAGVNPVYGLYTLMLGTPVASMLTSTRVMVFNTTSAMTLVAADGLGDRTGDERVAALIVIALVAGAFQIALGILGLGQLTRFVSNSVMIGFLTGIAVLIILGQLWDLTGYSGEGDNKLEQTTDLLAHLGEIDPWTTVVGFGSLALMFWLNWTRLAKFNLLIALAVSLAFVQILELFDVESVALVSSLGEIPRSLPIPDLPSLRLIPDMALAAVAVAIVGLLQAAGVAQQFPNSDGSDPDDSRDFLAQGVGNVATSLVQGMPGGGSLSGTALVVASGATTRWANVIQGPVVIILVLVFSGVLSIIPMAALAALLIYSATLAIKVSTIMTVTRTTVTSSFTMLVTFVATLVVPLQQAVLLGVVLAAVLFVYRASLDVRVVELQRVDSHIVESEPPAALPGDTVTLIDIHGDLFYAGARTLSQRLPSAQDSKRAVVVLRIRGQQNIGSTFLNVVGRYAQQVRANGGMVLLSGVDPVVKERMTRTGHLNDIGEQNVFVANSIIAESTEAAFETGKAWLDVKRRTHEPIMESNTDVADSESVVGGEQSRID